MPKAKPKAKTELLYAFGDKELNRKEYLQSVLKDAKTQYADTEIEADHIISLMEMVENEEEPADDVDDAYKAIFAQMQEAHDKAKTGLKTEKVAAKAEEAKAEKAKEEKQDHKLTVFNAAMAEPDMEALNAKFSGSAKGVVVHEDATDEEVAVKFRSLAEANEFTGYAVGDLGKEMKKRGMEDVLDQIIAATGLKESTIYALIKTAELVPYGDPRRDLKPTLVGKIIKPILHADPKKDAKLKEGLIADAIKNNWTVSEAESHISASRSTSKGKQGNASKEKPANFLVVPAEGEPYLSKEEPGYVDGEIAFNLKTRQLLDVVEKEDGKGGTKEVVEWVDLKTK